MTTPEQTGPAPRAHGLSRYKNGPDEHGTPGTGCRCPICRAKKAAWQRNRYRMIAYGQWQPFIPAAGSHRRIQALMWNGWSLGQLAARLGCHRRPLLTKMTRDQITPASAAAIRALYDELWDQPPPETTRHERAAATRIRRHARARGWVPPQAWDDDEIDDPAATPVPGWDRDGTMTRRYGVLAEDAAWLLEDGKDELWVVAERLGVAPGTIGVTLTRAARKQEAGSSRAA